jgi:flavin-dependent dehydrogenase
MVAPLQRNDEQVDVVVIGGGPAGATTATLIAQAGYSVRLFEREHFPRFHIGESLIPNTYFTLERLGMLPKLRGSKFVEKYSVQFVTDTGKLSEPFYFDEYRPHASAQTWQVVRSEFDELMLRNASAQGVQVYEGARVLEVLFTGEQATGVRVRLANGQEQTVHARVIVDASGQSSLLLDRLKLREWDPVLKKAALWTYWEGAFREPGQRDGGATLVLQTQGKIGWFWYIPLQNDIVSVGVVTAYDQLLKQRGDKDHAAIYAEQVARCPGLQPRLEGARQVAPFRAAKEYSYKARQAAGAGWVLVGDAYGFLDPLYSSGVLLALKSGELAADAIVSGLASNNLTGTHLGAWEPDYVRGMERMRRLVCAFYDGFNFGRFIKKHPHLKGHLTDLLMGDLFTERVDEVWAPMDAMRQELGMAAVLA